MKSTTQRSVTAPPYYLGRRAEVWRTAYSKGYSKGRRGRPSARRHLSS